jgi:GTP-binding protein
MSIDIQIPKLFFNDVQFVKSATRPDNYPPPQWPEVAVAGRSNVGKSALLNSLFRRRSLVQVSRTPGRTQLLNFFDIDQALTIVDLPGYGFAKVPENIRRKWRPMIEKYLHTRPTLIACLLLFDIRRTPSAEDIDMWQWLKHFQLLAVPVVTKIDKLSRQQCRNQLLMIADTLDIPLEAIVSTSAQTHAGREQLQKIISGLLWSAKASIASSESQPE